MNSAPPEQAGTGPVTEEPDPVGPLHHRPAWMVATRVSALAGYATVIGMAGATSAATCTVISANPLL